MYGSRDDVSLCGIVRLRFWFCHDDDGMMMGASHSIRGCWMAREERDRARRVSFRRDRDINYIAARSLRSRARDADRALVSLRAGRLSYFVHLALGLGGFYVNALATVCARMNSERDAMRCSAPVIEIRAAAWIINMYDDDVRGSAYL